MNNPCETLNAAIKRDVTLRRKMRVAALVPQLLTLCQSESVTARPFVITCEPDAKLARRVKAMNRANLLSLESTTRGSIAFLLSRISVDTQRVVRVLSSRCPRVYDEIRHRTLEGLPVSAQLNKPTANMEARGMPTHANGSLASGHRIVFMPLQLLDEVWILYPHHECNGVSELDGFKSKRYPC